MHEGNAKVTKNYDMIPSGNLGVSQARNRAKISGELLKTARDKVVQYE